MGRTTRAALGALAIALSGISIPAAAAPSTAGWSEADRSAATIREFQTRLMVAALRCRAAGINVLASYNQFVAADRAELAAANDRLKAHFASLHSVTGDRDYDRYTTSLANGFAGEQWTPQSCDASARLAREATESRGNLLAVALRGANEEIADASPSPSPWDAYDRGSRPGYDDRAPASRDNDEWQAPQAYDDRAPPPGYDDRGAPPRYRDDWQAPQPYDDRGQSWDAQQAYNDQAPPPGYYGRAPSGYDDRAPSPYDDDRSEPRGYGGY